MKLIKKYLSEIKRTNSLNLQCGDLGCDDLDSIIEAWESGVSNSILDAEVVTDEDGVLYDYRVFDPHHKLGDDIYINFNGWSEWRNHYEDNEGNGIDTIFDEYCGVPQGF